MQTLDILVVDDDPVTLSLLLKKLTKEDYQVSTAEDGAKAVQLMNDRHFDVIVTDLMMPGEVDGIGVLEAAKENDIKTDVILITAHGSIDNAILAMKKGATDYLQKPIKFDELILRLGKIQTLKHLMKNASDLREAMQVTEQTSSETIQHLELAVADLEDHLVSIKSILSRSDIAPEERIEMALAQ